MVGGGGGGVNLGMEEGTRALYWVALGMGLEQGGDKERHLCSGWVGIFQLEGGYMVLLTRGAGSAMAATIVGVNVTLPHNLEY